MLIILMCAGLCRVCRAVSETNLTGSRLLLVCEAQMLCAAVCHRRVHIYRRATLPKQILATLHATATD